MEAYDMTSMERLLLLYKESQKLQKEIGRRPSNNRLNYVTSIFAAQNHKAYTIWSICNPLPRSELLENSSVIHDYQSGYVLLRSMYETILVSRFILIDDQFANSRMVIVEIAHLHGLREQNWLLSKLKRGPRSDEVKADITRLKAEILQHPQYNSLPQFAKDYVNRNDIPNGPWLPKKLKTTQPICENKDISTMEELAHRVGFHESQHFQYHKYFSNYIHSDPFVIMQLAAVMHLGETEQMTERLYYHAENFLAISISNYLAILDSESVIFKVSEKVNEIINFWKQYNSRDWQENNANL